MSRIKDLQKQVHRDLEKMEDEDKRLKAVSHLHGVALAAAVLAKRRGENAELATMAGLLHDLYAYKSGSYDDHAHFGADYARKLLEKLAITTPEGGGGRPHGRDPQGRRRDRPQPLRPDEGGQGARGCAQCEAVRGAGIGGLRQRGCPRKNSCDGQALIPKDGGFIEI